MEEDNVFSKIVKGEIPAYKIYEDDQVMAFLDINPVNEGHTLVIPKQGYEQLWEVPDDIYMHLMKASKLLAQHIQKVTGAFRVGVIVEGFEVPHAHVHLIPLNEGMKQSLDNRPSGEPNHDALKAAQEKLQVHQ